MQFVELIFIREIRAIMRALIQRVTHASCTVDGEVTGKIDTGFLVLIGIEDTDTDEDLQWLAQKICGLRVFGDENGMMNKALADVDGNILLISQFTLFAQTKKGNRPSFIKAARPEKAIPLYEKMIETLKTITGKKIATGIFGADMKISLLNDGPVTIIMDTKDKDNH
jgi:D-tyrosyl-tRNA(Tyr) deacylase